MKNIRTAYFVFGFAALFLGFSALAPEKAEAQYTYTPDYYNYSAGYGSYYPDYSSSYFGYGYGQPYNATFYYPQFDPYYSQYYQQYQTPYYQYPYYQNPYYPYYQYPGYDDDYDYDTRPLRVSCKADESVVRTNELVTWTARASGGNGKYRYDWEGERISDNEDGKEVTVKYRSTGTKAPTVTVRSGDRKITRECTPITVTNQGWW
jgi:hypothetical protein